VCLLICLLLFVLRLFVAQRSMRILQIFSWISSMTAIKTMEIQILDKYKWNKKNFILKNGLHCIIDFPQVFRNCEQRLKCLFLHLLNLFFYIFCTIWCKNLLGNHTKIYGLFMRLLRNWVGWKYVREDNRIGFFVWIYIVLL